MSQVPPPLPPTIPQWQIPWNVREPKSYQFTLSANDLKLGEFLPMLGSDAVNLQLTPNDTVQQSQLALGYTAFNRTRPLFGSIFYNASLGASWTFEGSDGRPLQVQPSLSAILFRRIWITGTATIAFNPLDASAVPPLEAKVLVAPYFSISGTW